LLLMFFFIRRSTSELRQPIATKLWHMIAKRAFFIMQVQKFGGPSPKEIGGQKHAKFGAISHNFKLHREYLRNGSIYPKLERRVIINDSSRVQRKKSSELWFTDYRELYVSLNPPKLHFSGEYISALREWWPRKF